MNAGGPDDRAIEAFLRRDAVWSAYALCDLLPPYRRRARFLAALDGEDSIEAVVLLYHLPAWTVLAPFGPASAVARVLSAADTLPDQVYLLALPEQLPGLAMQYRLTDTWEMERMALPAAELRSFPEPALPVRRLLRPDAPALNDMYRELEGAAFDESMLDGLYLGAFDGEELVAVTGTHTISRDMGIGAIGGVFTRQAYRGRGLATALTGMVCRDLAGQGIELLVLNVRVGNAPALTAYRRLGFRTARTYSEGHAGRRQAVSP